MHNLDTLTLPNASGSLEQYLRTVHQIPILSAEEEQALAINLHDNNDLNAARSLVISHLRFVVYIARGYNGYGLPQADLIQEGNIGLMKAVKRFDPNVGVRLVSFAVHWIRAEIHEFVLKNWRIVKVATTKAQRKLFFNLRSAKKRLGWLNKEEIDIVAKNLQVSPQDVIEMEQRMSAHDLAFDAPYSDDDDASQWAPAQYLAANEPTPEESAMAEQSEANNSQQLQNALQRLGTRERDIITKRWLSAKKSTLQELAANYQISAERVRQLEKNAMQHMKTAIRASGV